MHNLIKTLNKIKLMIMIYLIVLPIVLLDLETVYGMNPHDDTNNQYVSKRNRGYAYKIKCWLKSRANKIYRWVIERSEMIKTKRKVNIRKQMAQRMSTPCRLYPRGRSHLRKIVIAYPVIAMIAGQTGSSRIKQQRTIMFDTDGEQVGIDNRCSACISNKIEDFVGNPVQTKRTIKGFGGARVSNIMTGTIKWK